MAAKRRKKPVPTNPKLYARVKAEAKRKFKVYPSAYANGWLVKTYKKRGGRYRMSTPRKKKRWLIILKLNLFNFGTLSQEKIKTGTAL